MSERRQHDAEIERAFTLQAHAFEDRATNGPFTTEADWMLDGQRSLPWRGAARRGSGSAGGSAASCEGT